MSTPPRRTCPRGKRVAYAAVEEVHSVVESRVRRKEGVVRQNERVDRVDVSVHDGVVARDGRGEHRGCDAKPWDWRIRSQRGVRHRIPRDKDLMRRGDREHNGPVNNGTLIL